MLADVWERLKGMRVGGKSRSNCPLRDAGGFDWTSSVDGGKWSCFHCEREVDQVLEYNHKRVKNNFR